jgi:hypothetical protein
MLDLARRGGVSDILEGLPVQDLRFQEAVAFDEISTHVLFIWGLIVQILLF